MSTPSRFTKPTVPAQPAAPATLSAWRVLYWSIRREVWESRSIYIAPLAAAGLFLIGFAINLLALRHRGAAQLSSDLQPLRLHGAAQFNSSELHERFAASFELSAALIMGTGLIVGVFYSIDCLYGERRDRSILFWKSLPVSDFITVLSKLSIPLLILPLISFVISIGTHLSMLMISSLLLIGSGLHAPPFADLSFLHISAVLIYHFVTVHGLWYLPIYGWLLMISAWAPRAPFIWAFVPPFVIAMVEKVSLNTSYFLDLLRDRLLGSGAGGMDPHPNQDFMASLIPHDFFSTPGLWSGVVVAAIFIFIAVRVRRYRGPL